jgi:hypothetical protein
MNFLLQNLIFMLNSSTSVKGECAFEFPISKLGAIGD